jgi:mannose-1-phosphate guanylyltransferase
VRAILLAAGFGSRLRPITLSTPKCLVPIQGTPLLDYWLAALLDESIIERVLINTHHLAEQVRAHVATSRWRERIELVHEAELLGTGGTLKANRAFWGEEPVLVAHADNLTEFDLRAFATAHAGRPAHCAMTMLAFRSDDPRSCGILELDDASVVRGFHEKVADPPGNLANAAVYLMTPEVTCFIHRLTGPFVDLSTEVIPAFVGRILAVETQGYHRDVGTLESLAKAEAEFRP